MAALLARLLQALDGNPNAVLIAPPGAGKTTAVAPALLGEAWCDGQILLLSPRRLAARAAAERMAELAGEPVGKTIGYATRMDSRVSAGSRIVVLTEGIFTSRIQADPELAGVSAVLFDEVHERSLASDFGLALALDTQAAFRPDLRLVAMSATLDGSRFAELMDAPVFESAGRAYPLDIRHIGRRPEARIEDEMAAAIRRALGDAEGDILAFLPGIREIEHTIERLQSVGASVHKLHGSLALAEQRAALAKGTGRKIILATSIAETSLTIDGVRIVIDSGLARRARYDRAAGVTQLVTERASQAAATQRAGRAARQAPGIAWRLWEEAATSGLLPFDPPEILEADLASLTLDAAIWGVTDPATLKWIDPPPASGVAEARRRLGAMGAIDAQGHPTAHGRAVAKLPLSPALAHMLCTAAERGFGLLGAETAMLLTERGLGGQDVDIEARRSRWMRERGERADAARRLAKRLAALAGGAGDAAAGSVAECLALAFPDRVARRRDASGELWLSASGRGYRLDPAHPLTRSEWLAIGDVQGVAAKARILAAADIAQAQVEALFAGRIESGTRAIFDPVSRAVQIEGGRRLGAIRLGGGDAGAVPREAIAAALVEGVRFHGLEIMVWPEPVAALRARALWAGVEALSDAALTHRLDSWLPPLVARAKALGEIADGALHDALRSLLDWDSQTRLDRLAPARFVSPAGTGHAIDYQAPGGPTVEIRVQALFGLAEHPVIGRERTPLILSLTSPAGRPIQTTRDLPGFWRGSWADVAKEMRGRYPRHNWPDDPLAAHASLRTKKALADRR